MKKTISIADKPTLDEVKALLENSGYGLEALKSLIDNSGGNYNGDFFCDYIKIEKEETKEINITGKGIIYINISTDTYFYSNCTITIDGVTPNNINRTISGNGGNYCTRHVNKCIPIEFKESLKISVLNVGSGNDYFSYYGRFA